MIARGGGEYSTDMSEMPRRKGKGRDNQERASVAPDGASDNRRTICVQFMTFSDKSWAWLRCAFDIAV